MLLRVCCTLYVSVKMFCVLFCIYCVGYVACVAYVTGYIHLILLSCVCYVVCIVYIMLYVLRTLRCICVAYVTLYILCTLRDVHYFCTGTGTNACYLEELERIEKWEARDDDPSKHVSFIPPSCLVDPWYNTCMSDRNS